jgi:hypothetical protein
LPDPQADVGFEVLDVRVDTAPDLLISEEVEPSLDLVDPGRTRLG